MRLYWCAMGSLRQPRFSSTATPCTHVNAYAVGAMNSCRGRAMVQAPPAWSRRMPDECYQHWRARMVAFVPKPWLKAEPDVLIRLYSVAGFAGILRCCAGIRCQAGTLVSLWPHAWTRRRRESDPFPRLPQVRCVQRSGESAYPCPR